MAQSASKSCDICMSGPGCNYCEQCDQWMCENCKTFHLRSNICQNHTFLSGSNINPEERSVCKVHDENFIFYCIRCNMPICKICSVKKHKKHDMSEINESTQEFQAEVKKVIEWKIKSVKTNLDKIEQGTGKYKIEINEAIHVITEEGKQMKLWIDKKVEALIKSLMEEETVSIQNLHHIRTEFQNDKEKLEKRQKVFALIQKTTDVAKRLKQLKNFKSELDDARKRQSFFIPTIQYNKRNVSEREMIDLFGDITLTVIAHSVEQTPKKEIRYKCYSCGKEKVNEKCDKCGYIGWFKHTS